VPGTTLRSLGSGKLLGSVMGNLSREAPAGRCGLRVCGLLRRVAGLGVLGNQL
jgi:hypothetical protein